MTNALRSLRWFSGLGVVFIGVVPVLMVALLVARGRTPDSVGLLLIGGIPLVLAALVSTGRGMIEKDPEVAARRLRLGNALVAGAAVLMLGGNALIRMGSS